MENTLKKLKRKKIQNKLDSLSVLIDNPTPKEGWIRSTRLALGMPAHILRGRMDHSGLNITASEKQEIDGNIELRSLKRIANALNCRLVYGFVPLEPLEKMLQREAEKEVKKRMNSLPDNSKKLTEKQLQLMEETLIKELLDNPTKIWTNKI